MQRLSCGARYFLWNVLILIPTVLGLFGPALRAQDIRIKVVDGRNGRIINDECVNVWVGEKTVEALLIPTNRDGIALLHLVGSDRDTNVQRNGSACGGWGVVDPVVRYADKIGITTGHYMPCQAHPVDSPRLLFSVQEVLRFGAATANLCGRIEASLHSGELIFFVRPLHWWERVMH